MKTDSTAAARAATAAILSDLAAARHQAVVVDSPPGAGKSTLVVRAAQELAAGGERPVIIAQTNNQVDDLIEKLAVSHPNIALGRLSASDYSPPPALSGLANTVIGRTLADLTGCQVIVGTAAKWATVRDGTFGWAILDESYQMRSDMLLQLVERFDRGLFVGDPGQLDPFTIVGTERWIGLPHDPTQNGVSVMLEHNPRIPVHRLPVSWRLPSSAAPTISQAFYPFTNFTAGTSNGTRALEFRTPGLHNTCLDETLSMAFTTGWALHELPRRHVPRTDTETIRAAAHLAERLLTRGAVATCEHNPAGRDLRAADIAIGVAHRDQADLVRAALARTGTPGRTGGGGRHREPAAGPRVRSRHRRAPVVRPTRRHRLPPRSRTAVRTRLPPPAGMHRRRPRRHRRSPRHPPLHRSHPPVRAGQIPRRLGSQPNHAGQARPASRRRITLSAAAPCFAQVQENPYAASWNLSGKQAIPLRDRLKRRPGRGPCLRRAGVVRHSGHAFPPSVLRSASCHRIRRHAEDADPRFALRLFAACCGRGSARRPYNSPVRADTGGRRMAEEPGSGATRPTAPKTE